MLLRLDHPTEPRCRAHAEPVDQSLRVEDLIDRLVRAVDRATVASVNAGACGTSRDFRAADDASVTQELVRERVVAAIEQYAQSLVDYERVVARTAIAAAVARAERAEERATSADVNLAKARAAIRVLSDAHRDAESVARVARVACKDAASAIGLDPEVKS